MSDEEILNNRWKKVDQILRKNLKGYTQISRDLQDKIIELYNSLGITYQDLNKPLSKKDLKTLQRKIREYKKNDLLSAYLVYLITRKNPKKYTYSDMLEIMLYGLYEEANKEIKEQSIDMFTNIANESYNQAKKEMGYKPKEELSLNWEYILALLVIPAYNKNLYEYLDMLVLTDEQEMYNKLLVYLQKGIAISGIEIQELIKKQTNRILSISVDKTTHDYKYSGVMSDTARTLTNEVYIEPYKEEKDVQVRFIAEMDKKTTKMCKSMNGMLFYINKQNDFYRYSDVDKKDIFYSVFGLELGINLPPIMNHFHWCRSTITYLTDLKTKSDLKIQAPILKTVKGIHFDGGFYDNYGVYHPIEGKEKISIPSEDSEEFELALWLKNKVGGDIHLVPTIDTVAGNKESANTKTPDIIWNGEKWDFKGIKGNTKNTIAHKFEDYKDQTDNLILFPNNTNLTDEEIIKYISKSIKRYSEYYDKVIYMKDYEIIKEFK